MLFSLTYIHQYTHIYTFTSLATSHFAKHAYKDAGRACLEKQSHSIKGDFCDSYLHRLCFSNISKTYSNGIYTMTEMHHSMPRQSGKLKITQWNSLMWHRYMSKLYHTIYLHNKCIAYIVFFRSGVSSKWVAKTLSIKVKMK